MKFMSIILIGLLFNSISNAQDQLSKEELLKEWHELQETYKDRILGVRYSVTGKLGKDHVDSDYLIAIGPGFGYLKTTGQPTLAMGFNQKYAFQIRQTEKESKWSVHQSPLKATDPMGYRMITTESCFISPCSHIGLSEVKLLSDLLKKKIVKIEKCKVQEDGKFTVKFTPDIHGDLKRDEYDLKHLKLSNNTDGLSDKELLAAMHALGARPTEVDQLECTVDPRFNFFITETKLVTRDFNQRPLTWHFRCEGLKRQGGLVIPIEYSTRRISKNHSEILKTTIQSVTLDKAPNLDDSPSKLGYYGLKEPKY